ncbi:hypothetical protein L6452_16188 [Arctium lappa]|uniref:Uncharacterized protein n=1 Tax=Arctium lappa TaxID=4217 RepID=A0ACB9C068_ARCLA|nr:hypothetical protein L6452_16188 [Arctium lappa]
MTVNDRLTTKQKGSAPPLPPIHPSASIYRFFLLKPTNKSWIFILKFTFKSHLPFSRITIVESKFESFFNKSPNPLFFSEILTLSFWCCS